MAFVNRVRVTNFSIVSPPSDTTTEVGSIKLTFFDVVMVHLPPVQRLFMYQTETSKFPSLVQRVKESLSHALQDFRPLSGKLIYSRVSDELEISCASAGVDFIEAESEEDISQLAGNDVHDSAGFWSLVPKMEIGKLPAPLFAVQLTRFPGGVSIGISVNHVAVDGNATLEFVKSWAGMCRTGLHDAGPTICWDRSAFRDPLGIEIIKVVRGALAPSLPKLPTSMTNIVPNLDPPQPIRRTFIFTWRNIQWLKYQVMHEKDDCSAPVSTFVAVAAYAWICGIQAKGLVEDEDTIFIFSMDCRKHLSSRIIPTQYFGNCVRPLVLKAKAFQLLGKDGFVVATKMIQRAVLEAQENPLAVFETCFTRGPDFSSLRMYVSGSPRFKVYETDFGWGRPSRVEMVTMSREGHLNFAEARDGGVQFSVALFPLHMDKFASLFLTGLDAEAMESES